MKDIALALIIIFVSAVGGFAQTNLRESGSLRGKVKFQESDLAVRNATVKIPAVGLTATTDEAGNFEFPQVPVGKFTVIVSLERISDVVKTVNIGNGQKITADFSLSLSSVREEVTVTASGSEESQFEAYQSVTTVSALQIAEKNTTSIGEALDHQLGVAKRSFGPGTSRPVIRGFDGDRVLVLQDGIRLGGLGFQSGDHGEPIDILSAEKIEVLKGPATLLYGSNAVGGVVNVVSGNDSLRKGFSGYVTTFGGTNNMQLGGNAGVKAGTDKFLFTTNGGGQKANDYGTPEGRVVNSFAKNKSLNGSLGYFPKKGFFDFAYNYDQRRYGIPVDLENAPDDVVYINMRRHSYIFRGGFSGTNSFLERGNFTIQYNDYNHGEFESATNELATDFINKTFVYQANFEQKKYGKLSGTFGFSGFNRDYETIGDESITPRTKQNNFAVFALEKLDFEKIGFQFGGRFESNNYKPRSTTLPDRTFRGISSGIGFRVPLWEGGAFVANYTNSYRAVALEELYNDGPHPGNLLFEIGDPNLEAERSNGIDLLLRQRNDKLSAEASFFYYRISNFVFFRLTGEFREGLPVAEYVQGNSRFYGAEARLRYDFSKYFAIDTNLDYINAELTVNEQPLPRIPPFRATVGAEWSYKNFIFRPEVVLSGKQDRVFDLENPTSGFAVVNTAASYSVGRERVAHIFSFNGYNLTNKLYRNHLSLIKDRAPEIGRGFRLSYTLRFF